MHGILRGRSRGPRDDGVVGAASQRDNGGAGCCAFGVDVPQRKRVDKESTAAVPGEWLEALAVRVKLHRTEWRVLAIVISSSGPASASNIAKRLRLDYGLVKRVVRELVLWNILRRTAGLTFQPDHTRWGPPRPRPVA